jgi:hypothetical protein
MALEDIPGSVASDDNLKIIAGPASAFPSFPDVTLAEAKASVVKAITYSLTETGFQWTMTQESVPDPRLTLAQVLSQPGRKTYALTLQYVWGADDDVADVLFVEGEEYVIGARFAVPNETDITAVDKFDWIKARAGAKAKDAPTANGKWTKTQIFYPTGQVVEDQVLGS